MTATEIVLSILLAASFVMLIIVITYFKYFRVYTRERFAFRVFLLIASLIATLIAILLSGGSAIAQIINALLSAVGLDQIEHEPTISDKLLTLTLVAMLIHLAISLHRNWPGAISTREHDAALLGIRPTVVGGAIAAVADLTGKEALQTYLPSRINPRASEMLLSPNETKAWHHWTARMLKISSNQFHIDEINDWFPERRLYISSYGAKKFPIAILCREMVPSKGEILNEIAFVKSQIGGLPIKLLIAVDSESGDRCIETVDGIEVETRCRGELVKSLVDFSQYVEDIEFRYGATEIAEGYRFKLPDVYVPSSGHMGRLGERASVPNVEDYVAHWATENTLKHLAILGEYGQGKSVLALKLTHRLLHSAGRVPVLITLGGRSPRTQSKLEILADWAASYGINPKALLVLHELGQLVLIFDGFDEMDLVGDATLRMDHFRTLWEFSRDRRAKILITGRPNFFLDQIERERSLNVRHESIEVPYTMPIYLDPFSVDQIALALREFDESVRTQIVELVKAPDTATSFRDLVSRPSTLFLAANIWNELNSIDNIRSAEVIGRFISHSYERQQRKGLRSFLTGLEREYFTVGIALAARQETHFSNHISKDAFQRAITRLIDGFPEEIEAYETITNARQVPLKERLQDREMLIETVSTDVRSCGVVVTDLSQTDTFKFAHKSFFEYLLALNTIFTLFQWPESKERALHHSARNSIGHERSFSFVVWLFEPAMWARVSANRETMQFAGEILYKLVGGRSGMSESELDAKLSAINVPVRLLRKACVLWRGRKHPSLTLLLITFPFYFRLPPGVLGILAAFFRVHGHGGEEFKKLDDERRLRAAANVAVSPGPDNGLS